MFNVLILFLLVWIFLYFKTNCRGVELIKKAIIVSYIIQFILATRRFIMPKIVNNYGHLENVINFEFIIYQTLFVIVHIKDYYKNTKQKESNDE